MASFGKDYSTASLLLEILVFLVLLFSPFAELFRRNKKQNGLQAHAKGWQARLGPMDHGTEWPGPGPIGKAALGFGAFQCSASFGGLEPGGSDVWRRNQKEKTGNAKPKPSTM